MPSHLDQNASVRMDVTAPRISMEAIFTRYQQDITDALEKEVVSLMESGAIVDHVVAEFHRQLPLYLEDRVKAAMRHIDIDGLMKTMLQQAMASLVKGEK